ncbi:MAG: Gfo/Idh/MocA family oxidoreductase [Candidatus Omnitrophica bacterium]|nr:Gfo/Idh/MocA family oxidoreductase [Candidatus Omnitrophota bacterium]
MNKSKCIIIGFGYMGEIRGRVIDQHGRLELIGVCEPDNVKREKIKGVAAVSTYQEALALNPDIVFVCAPNCFAPEITIQSLRRGVHVFCEKPPGRNVQDVLDMRAAEHSSVKLMFGFNHRYHPGILKAKAVLETGRLGRIISLRGVYGKSGGAQYHTSWRNDIKISGGGILLDQGIHMLDLFRFFCDDFDQVKCFASTSYWKFNDLEDNAFVILKNKQGQTASLYSSATLWKHTFQINIICEDGYMTVEGLLSKSGSYGRERLKIAKRQFEDEAAAVGNPSEEITYFDRDQSWNLEVDEFVDCVQNNKPVSTSSSHDALRVMEIVDQAYSDAGMSFSQEIKR